MNKLNRDLYYTNIILNKLDRIEDRLGIMAHNIPVLREQLEKWQNNKQLSILFNEQLNKFIDQLNNKMN